MWQWGSRAVWRGPLNTQKARKGKGQNMKAKQERYSDDDKSVTVAEEVQKIVKGSSYGDVTWGLWCVREKARMNAVGGGGRVRIAKGEGRMWLTRA